MSAVAFEAGDLFTIRVVKHHESNPDRKWANAYEFRAVAGGGEGELLDLGNIIVIFEAQISFSFVIFDRILISTWQADSKPYNPEVFISSTLTAGGGRVPSGSQLALNQALSVTRQASSGRFGHLFYRGCLAESDVGAPAGISTLTDRPAIQSMVEDAVELSGLGAYLGLDSDAALEMVMIGKPTTPAPNVRKIINLRVQDVTTIPTDHAWFNRTTPTP